MLSFKKIFLAYGCLTVINMHGSTTDDSSPLAQAAFLLAKKQAGRQVANQALLKLQSEAPSRPQARKLNHRKKRNRKKQVVGNILQELVQMQMHAQAQANQQPRAFVGRMSIRNTRIS